MNNYPSQSLFEAMKVGCCIVATDVGETRKVLLSEKLGLVRVFKLLIKKTGYLEKVSAKGLYVFDQHNLCRYSEYFLDQATE